MEEPLVVKIEKDQCFQGVIHTICFTDLSGEGTNMFLAAAISIYSSSREPKQLA